MSEREEMSRLVPTVVKIAKGFSVTDDEYESVALEALVDAFAAWSKDKGPLEAFVRVVVRNRLRSYRRKKQWEFARGLSGGTESQELLPARPAMSLHNLVERLDEPLKTAAMLRLVHDLPWRYVARGLGVPVKEAKRYVVLAASIMLRRIKG
jgi:DNA-directed RNA polymerase specialized sigma24 family protein